MNDKGKTCFGIERGKGHPLDTVRQSLEAKKANRSVYMRLMYGRHLARG